MLTRQKEKIETGPSLKDEKQKLKTLNEFLEKCQFISTKTKENSIKSQTFLNRFSEELGPILKKSFELKGNCQLIDQALSDAKSKLDYLQNAKAVERKLSQRVSKEDLASFLAAMDKGMIIYEFTKSEKHTNEYHAETNDKMEKALEFATQQLTALFSETVIDLIENNEKGSAEALTLMDQYFHKLGNLSHFDTYVNTKDKEFSKRIREIIAISESEAEESYKKGSHPALNGILTFINYLKQGKMEVYKIFSSADANLVYQNLVNSLYRTFVELCDSLLGPKSTFANNFQFFASLDFLERLVTSSETLQSAMGAYYSAIEDVIDRFSSSIRNFIKNYSRYLTEDNKRPEDEQISHITYKAIGLILQLQEYHKALSNLGIESEISGAIIKSVVRLLEDNRSFIKSKNPIMPVLYTLNNLFYMISQTQNDDSDVIIDYASKDMMDELLEKNIQEYLLLSWNNVEDVLNNDIQVANEKNGNLKTSTKKAIKKKFSEVNRRVEEFKKVHKDLWFVSREFVETLQRKNKKHILAKYQSFYNTYGELSFTKNRDKYVKYPTLSALSNAIDEGIKYQNT